MAYKFQLENATMSGTLTQRGDIIPAASDGSALGSTDNEWSDLYLADGAVIALGDDQEVTLTHVRGSGVLLNGSGSFQFGDSGTYINQSTNGTLSLVADNIMAFDAQGTDADDGYKFSLGADSSDVKFQILNNSAQSKFSVDGTGAGSFGSTLSCGAITSTGASSFGSGQFSSGIIPNNNDSCAIGSANKSWSDLYLADEAVIYLGNDSEVMISHVQDSGVIFQNVAAGAASAATINLRLSSSSPANSDEMGKLQFSGFNNAEETFVAGHIVSKVTDVTNDSEDASMTFNCIKDGSGVEFLNLNGTQGAATFSQNLTVGVDDTGYDVKYFGATSGKYMLWDESDDELKFPDTVSASFGTGADLVLHHDGTNSYIQNKTGALKIATEASGIAVTIGHTTSEVTIADNLTVTGDLTVAGTATYVNSTTVGITGSFVFEGASADGYETTLGVVDPTADHSVQIANVAGYLQPFAAASTTQISASPTELNYNDITTLGTAQASKTLTIKGDSTWTVNGMTCADLGTVTTIDINGGSIDGATLGGDSAVTITNADMNGGSIDGVIIGAASALAGTFSTLDCNDGAFAIANLDIDGATDLGEALVNADLFIVDNGAGGTNRKCTMSRLRTYIGSQTVVSGANATIVGPGINYFDAHGGAITATLSNSASVGESIYIKAGSDCSATNTLTVSGYLEHVIDGAGQIVLESPYAAVQVVYASSGSWRVF